MAGLQDLSKAEVMILVAGIASAWDSINKDQENYDPELTKRVEKIFEGEFKPDGSLVNKELDEELNKNETFASLLDEVLSVYEGVYL